MGTEVMHENLEGDPANPEMLVEEFYGVIDAEGHVNFYEPGEPREPASTRRQAWEAVNLLHRIHNHDRVPEEDKIETGRRFERARDYLEGMLSSGR